MQNETFKKKKNEISIAGRIKMKQLEHWWVLLTWLTQGLEKKIVTGKV